MDVVGVYTAGAGRERRITGRTLFIAFSGQTGAREFSYEKRVPAGFQTSLSLCPFSKALAVEPLRDFQSRVQKHDG